MWDKYKPMKARSRPEVQTLPRMSLTSDIVSHPKVSKTYGLFVEKGFVPAHTVQIFYGTIIHEVLDRTHHHYQGFDDPKTRGTMPTDDDMERYSLKSKRRSKHAV